MQYPMGWGAGVATSRPVGFEHEKRHRALEALAVLGHAEEAAVHGAASRARSRQPLV